MKWQVVKLSELCEDGAPITYGILQPGPLVTDGVPYVRPSEIQDGQIDLESIRRTAPQIAARYKKSVLAEGDILITIVGTIGSIAVVPAELHGANITQSSARVRVCEMTASTHYIKHYLRSPLASHQYDRHRLGVAVPRLNLHHVRDLEIPLPPLAEQKRIAGILDAADALRAKRREAITQLDALVQSVFLDMFGDPVTNPKGWEVSDLGGVANFHAGSTLPGGTAYSGQSGGYLCLKVSDLNLPENSETVDLAQLWTIESGRGITAPSLSVVIPKRGGAISTNKKRILLRPAVLDPNLMAISAKCRVHYVYLYRWFHTFDLTTITSGSSVPQLNKRDLSPLPIQLPPLPLQEEFATIVESIDQQKAAHRTHLAELDALFASVQSRAFRGEL